MKRVLSLFALFLASDVHGENWPAWRGPHGDGVSNEKNLPVSWSATKNVKWKVALPDIGNSTPIIWNEHVFLTQALDGGKRRALLAFHRADGSKLWQQELPCSVMETTHKQNPPCSASPVTDGEAVYAAFASSGVIAFDFTGKKLWHRDFGPLLHRWGNGSSPILYKDLLIVFHGPGEPTFLVALNKRTGATVWKKEETAINSPIFGSWSTPVVARIGTRDELIMPLPGDKIGGDGIFKSYDPDTGKELWTASGLGNEIYAMPALSEAKDLVIGISGHNGPLMAVKLGGDSMDRVLWRQANKKATPQRVGSGVFHQGRFFLADAPGFVECLDPKTGEAIWKERLDGTLWGSMLLADSRLYVSSLEGDTYVLAAGPKFEVLSRNTLGEPLYAAPAAAHGEIFLRGYKHLYCISK